MDCDEDKNISLDKIIDMESKTNGVKLDNLIFRLKAANDNLKRKNAAEETKIKSLKKIKRLAHLITKLLPKYRDRPSLFRPYVRSCAENFLNTFDQLEKLKNVENNDIEELKGLFEQLIDEYLGLVENKKIVGGKNNNEKNEQVLVEIDGKSYDLKKAGFCYFEESYDPEKKHSGYGNNSFDIFKTSHMKILKGILNSKVVSVKTKQKVYSIAHQYKKKLEETYSLSLYRSYAYYLLQSEKIIKTDYDDFNEKGNLGYLENTETNELENKINVLKIETEKLKEKINDLKQEKINLENGIEDLDKLAPDKLNGLKEKLMKLKDLNIKSNVIGYFTENWTTWLSFILIVPIFIYIFKWKHQYINEITELKANIQSICNKFDVHVFDNNLEDKRNNLENKRNELENKINNLENKINELENKINELEDQINIKENESKIIEFGNKVRYFGNRIAVSELKIKISNLKIEIDKDKIDNESKMIELHNKKNMENVTGLENEITTLNNEIQVAEDKIKEKNSEIRQAEEKKEKYDYEDENEIDTENNKIEQTKSEITQLKEDIVKKEKQIDILISKLLSIINQESNEFSKFYFHRMNYKNLISGQEHIKFIVGMNKFLKTYDEQFESRKNNDMKIENTNLGKLIPKMDSGKSQEKSSEDI